MDDSTPPPIPPTPIHPAPIHPPAIVCLKIYMGLCACLGLLWLIIGVLEVSEIMEPQLGLIDSMLASADETMREELLAEEKQDAWLMAIMGPSVLAAYGFAVFLPRKPWAQSYANVLLGLSLLVCITLIPVILLFIFVNRWPGNTYFIDQ